MVLTNSGRGEISCGERSRGDAFSPWTGRSSCDAGSSVDSQAVIGCNRSLVHHVGYGECRPSRFCGHTHAGVHIQRQLAPLDAPAEEALATAAVIGREFDFGLLRAACACPPRKLAATLDELVRLRILTGTGDAFHFSHARVREVICGGLSSQRRKVLEDAVAHGRAYFLEEYRRRGWDR